MSDRIVWAAIRGRRSQRERAWSLDQNLTRPAMGYPYACEDGKGTETNETPKQPNRNGMLLVHVGARCEGKWEDPRRRPIRVLDAIPKNPIFPRGPIDVTSAGVHRRLRVPTSQIRDSVIWEEFQREERCQGVCQGATHDSM